MAGADGLMSPAGVAARSGLSRKTVYRAIASGALVAYRTHVALPDSGVVVRGMDYAGADRCRGGLAAAAKTGGAGRRVWR
jgi:hypothetical protein